jgi:ssDNA thymidine ADP-ribosyltransferase, DarT
VERDELEELHYITPINNVPSICRLGILSHRKVKKVKHESVAMEEIQQRRAKKTVPPGRLLHDYVNLYICARNKMLYKIHDRRDELCILQVSPAVLDLPEVIVSDRNASSEYARFEPAPSGLRIVDRELVFAKYWTHPDDPIEEMRHGSIKCAEVLVPDSVPARFIMGAYVSSHESLTRFNALSVNVPASIHGELFFR